jgi:hypothetical protein
VAPIELAVPAMPRVPFLSDFALLAAFDLKRFGHRFYALHDVSTAHFGVHQEARLTLIFPMF